jgi:predicted membrane protein
VSAAPPDVKLAHVIMAMLRGLSDKALKWTSVLMAFAITVAVLWRPNWMSAGVGVAFIALLSPLWLRKDTQGGS